MLLHGLPHYAAFDTSEMLAMMMAKRRERERERERENQGAKYGENLIRKAKINTKRIKFYNCKVSGSHMPHIQSLEIEISVSW